MRRFAVLLAMLFALPAFAQTIAIRAGNVIDPATGKTLWNIKPGGFVSYLSGKFIYTIQSFDPNPTDEDVLNDSLVDLQKPPYLRITRIDPKTGRTLWDHEQDRCPVAVQFDQNQILLIFKREVQVLKFLSL